MTIAKNGKTQAEIMQKLLYCQIIFCIVTYHILKYLKTVFNGMNVLWRKYQRKFKNLFWRKTGILFLTCKDWFIMGLNNNYADEIKTNPETCVCLTQKAVVTSRWSIQFQAYLDIFPPLCHAAEEEVILDLRNLHLTRP